MNNPLNKFTQKQLSILFIIEIIVTIMCLICSPFTSITLIPTILMSFIMGCTLATIEKVRKHK